MLRYAARDNTIIMIDKLKQIIEPILKEDCFELVDLIYRREFGNRCVLRILADRYGGITISECSSLNEKISKFLDEANIIEDSYVLEVASPGIDRFFKIKRDYERAKGRLVRVTLNEAVLDKKEYIGRLIEVLSDSIKIDVGKKGVIGIEFKNIIRAREEVEI